MTLWSPVGPVVVGPGECRYQPAGVPQTEKVTSDVPARVLDVTAPAGFDDFGFDRFVAAAGLRAERHELPGNDATSDFDRVAAAAQRFGIEILGPPGALP